MGRRIEVELTSCREDGGWTWRAAGAKQPKGELPGSLLYDGAKVGDVVKADATFHLDGIEITEVLAPKTKKARTDILEMKSRPLRDEELVTTQRVSRDRGRGKPGRGDRPARGRDRDHSGDRRRSAPSEPARPKPKRLRARREHRNALLESVPTEHRPIVEQVIKDGMPGVRTAIKTQNDEAKAAGKPEIDASPILAIAEKNLQKARLAEWRDKADAALSSAKELDLRDLRSVVVVGADVARDDESKRIAGELKTALDERMESDHSLWLEDLQAAVGGGRVVRALRLSSRPVKAGAALPTELATELATQASAALAADTLSDRWVVVLDALALSPVRGAVSPAGVPAEPSDDLVKEVRRLSDRIPAIAALFGVDPATVSKSEKRRRAPGREWSKKGAKKKGGGAANDRPKKDGPKPDRSDSQQDQKPTSEPKRELANKPEPAASSEPTDEADDSSEPPEQGVQQATDQEE